MTILELDQFSIIINGKTIVPKFSLRINTDEQWVIAGESGTGKTSLLHALAGRQAHAGTLHFPASNANRKLKMVLVDQQHKFRNLSNTGTFYYQQRFNSSDAQDAHTVEEDLKMNLDLDEHSALDADALETLQLLHIGHLLNTRLIQLSNGENKRLQIVKALLLHPDILLLDNPFIGLDVEARANLGELFEKITKRGIEIIMASSAAKFPRLFTHVLALKHDHAPVACTMQEYRLLEKDSAVIHEHFSDSFLFKKLVSEKKQEAFEFAVKMINVNIRYESRQILSDINWEVKRGDKWAISGHNGAGKSTLLSLVNADNPQAYANQVFLFDRKRGTGESIWDIKKKIGFVSPELHLYFESGINTEEVVASGLFDTIGLFRMLSDQQVALVAEWLELLNIGKLRQKLFSRLSTSEQRLVLLARALVKDPPLLILDEPCQGLDDTQVAHFKDLVNEICVRGNKTLLYVSHYKPEIPECVDKFLLLEGGRINSLTEGD